MSSRLAVAISRARCATAPRREDGRRILLLVAATLLLAPSPLWAIPSPDLVVSFFASAAQVLGLLTVVCGGMAFTSKRRGGRGSGAQATRWRWGFHVSLALLFVSVAGNVLQYTSRLDRDNVRLQANLIRSSTEGGKAVGDVNLKTLAFSDQVRHPHGMETQRVAELLAAKALLNLVDVREPEEVEMGKIETSWHERYPDLRKDPSSLAADGARTVLLCFSGNRSSELCEEFNARGYPCSFMIGGYEKWLSENRVLELSGARSTSELRDIASYPNKQVLLDTPDVLQLVEENAVFVDVRYPGEFAKHHLPGAINIPMRKLSSDELWRALKSIPRAPIVAPAYDKRSSFYAAILGLRLHRLGYDYRGRYTVPHEFLLPRKEKAHVAQWKAVQADKTLLGLIAAPLRASLGALTEQIGHLTAAIVLLVVALRILVLPLTLKSERDQFVGQQLAFRIKDLKARFADDPQRASRAVQKLQRQEGMTPLRNLFATMAQITIFLVFFSVVNNAAAGSTESFLWVDALGDPDPYYVLPLLVGGLIFLHLRLGAPRRTTKNCIVHAACGLLLVLLTFKLCAAVNVYLVFNVALLTVQSQLTRKYLRARRDGERKLRPAPDRGIVLLRDAHRVPGTGNKAIRLGRMMAAGLPVPDGFSVTDKTLSRDCDASGSSPLVLTSKEERLLEKAWETIQAEKVAVRSSGLNEDGASQSYAGIFESILNVEKSGLMAALDDVRSSLNTQRASAYAGNQTERGGVLVQKMVPAEYAGVLFTEHPASAGCAMVELISGLGEALVSGTATPEAFSFGRRSHRRLSEKAPPIDLTPLLALGSQVEQLFGKRQDIEWAYADGEFVLLQARDITTSIRDSSSAQGAFERERHRLMELVKDASAGETVFVQNELSELLPRPTPLSLSLMESLWAAGGSTDIACRNLGIPYAVEEDSPPFVNSVFGALYINRVEEGRRLSKGPGAVASFNLSRSAVSIKKQFMEDFLPEFKKAVRLRNALDLSRLSLEALFDLFDSWTRQFVRETYVEAELINVAADFYVKTASQQLENAGMSSASYLSRIPETVVHRAMSLLPEIRSGDRMIEEFQELFGHRAPQDYELAQPRYEESPEMVAELVSRATRGVQPAGQEVNGSAELEVKKHPVISLALERAREFQALKEEAKHHCLRELASLRRLLREIDVRLDLDGGGIFYLSIDEVAQLRNEAFLDQALDIIDRNRASLDEWKELRLPSAISLEDLESLDVHGKAACKTAKGLLQGKRVSGEKEVVGRARVIVDTSGIDEFEDGEILIARFTDPTWTPLFPRVAGVITEVGGWLSHAAIVAREYKVAAIVGAAGAMDRLETGDLVRMSSDGTVQKIEEAERRRHKRVPMSARVALLRQGEIIEAMLRNLSVSGALIDSEEELEEGQGLSIRIFQDSEEVGAEVVRRDSDGGYALRFTTPIPAIPTGTDGPGKN